MEKAQGSPNWLRVGIILVVTTMLYNVVEAVIALWAGVEAASIALIEFGSNSVIEIVAASVLIWRLRLEARGADSDRVAHADLVVHRFVGLSFMALALYVLIQSVWMLWHREVPGASTIGMLLATASLIIMPLVSFGKLRAATEVGSRALRAEAKETLACSYLSFTLLLGLGANAALSWWWADPVAALLMIPWLVKEGLEGLSSKEHEAESRVVQASVNSS